MAAASDPLEEKACDKCGAPASWADQANLSWTQSLRRHISTYFLSPRMWPIGYILESPYSPLWLEKQVSEKINWRDSFEDLLALESGGEMISLESRKLEADTAKEFEYRRGRNFISFMNDHLALEAKRMSVVQRMRKLAVDGKRMSLIKMADDVVPDVESNYNQALARATAAREQLKQQRDKSGPASSYKLRGEWMASLVTSGALPGWEAVLFDSSEGQQILLRKRDGDPNDPDSQIFTEKELSWQFDDGIPMTIGSPEWSTNSGGYPESLKSTGIMQRVNSLSVISQLARVERTKTWKGAPSIKVLLTNKYADGHVEEKEIIDDACKIYEEAFMARHSMDSRRNAFNISQLEVDYLKALQVVEKVENSDLRYEIVDVD